jgi:hypothetical protein
VSPWWPASEPPVCPFASLYVFHLDLWFSRLPADPGAGHDCLKLLSETVVVRESGPGGFCGCGQLHQTGLASIGARIQPEPFAKAMTSDFEQIPAIIDAAVGKAGSEFNFPFPEVPEVIRLCTINKIAVLGVEIFLVTNDGLYAAGCSDYDLRIAREWNEVKIDAWDQYVKENNALALECVHHNPAGDDHVYVLTTSSWREFREIQKRRVAEP